MIGKGKERDVASVRRWGWAAAFFLLFVVASTAEGGNPALESLRETGKAFSLIAKQVSPAVVFIQVEQEVSYGGRIPFNNPFDLFNDEFFRRFFGDRFPYHGGPRGRKYRQMGQGSGFIVSADGYILTNHHVVGEADKIIVKLYDDREFEAKRIGTDPQTDVAVIKIEGENLPVLPLGDSDALEVGEWVLAVGNPFGLSHTLTAGIVSAKGRSNVGIVDYEDFIQTDAAINPGNSGGPLVNLEGKAVGINSAIFTRSGGYMGIGFAIPINMAKKIQEQLIEHGSVTRGFLGVVIQDLTPELRKTFDLEDVEGILVADVSEDSPAEKAGIERGDVILECDGEPVKDVASFRNRIGLTLPGTKVTLKILRNGKQKTIRVTIGRLSGSMAAAAGSSKILDRLGLSVQDLTPELRRELGYDKEEGVLVSEVEPGSPAALAGLQRGHLILEVNRKEVRNVEEFERALERAANRKTILFLVHDGRYTRYVALSFSE
ncbi:MAG: DegQ family serine endoprotease [Deltaproteobacteria bacterium]|nr:MAG: DegQ family serine endoprotease [Deltaproteobacteria bacterium]